MKKSLLAILAMGSVAGVAHAGIPVLGNDKGSVEVYGILDAAAGHVQHSLSVDPQFPGSVNPYSAVKNNGTVPSSVNGLFNGGLQASRLGVKGGLDVGNGIKAFFTLESGINAPTGQLTNAAGCLASNAGSATTACANSSVNGQLFGRQAFVGLSEETLGSLALGRNYAPFYTIAATYDPLQNSDLFSPINFSGTFGGGGGVSEDSRVDSSLKYTNKFGSFNYGALYKFGGSSQGTSAKSAFAINAGYEAGNIGVQAAYQAFNDAIKGGSGSIANTVAITNENTKAFMIAAKYKFTDAATAKIGYITYTLSAPSDPLNTAAPFGYSYYGQAIDPTAGKGVTNFSGASQTTHIIFLGGDYNLTEKLNLAAGIYNITPQQSNDYTPNAGTTTAKTGQASGTQNCVSLLADYHLTKTLDTYAGVMHTSFSGNAYPSAAYYTSNQVVALGARFKF